MNTNYASREKKDTTKKRHTNRVRTGQRGWVKRGGERNAHMHTKKKFSTLYRRQNIKTKNKKAPKLTKALRVSKHQNQACTPAAANPHSSGPPTHLAVHEEEPRDGVPGEGCVGAAAHLARHVLHDVFPQERLDVLRHVLACGRERERAITSRDSVVHLSRRTARGRGSTKTEIEHGPNRPHRGVARQGARFLGHTYLGTSSTVGRRKGYAGTRCLVCDAIKIPHAFARIECTLKIKQRSKKEPPHNRDGTLRCESTISYSELIREYRACRKTPKT